MKPKIGISMNYCLTDEGTERAYLDTGYFEYVAQAGAMPFPIPPIENIVLLDALLNQFDGILFTGGRDLDPGLWHESQHEETQLLHPRRQRFEFMLYEQVKKRRLPILAICLGIQMINIAHGGSLHQHLPDLEQAIDHGGVEIAKHPVLLNPESQMYQWFKQEQIVVNSFHHQAVNRLGDNLLAAAVAPDGIIEAVEEPGYSFLLALQWHPERDPDNSVNSTIMERFLQICCS
jgi:putative glutamine amidotransferase